MERHDNNQSIEHLRKEKLPIIIYGALQSDEAIAKACLEQGIDIACICDDSKRKAGNNWCGYPVFSFEDVIKKYGKVAFILNISYIKPVVKKIEAAGCKWYSCKLIVESEAFRNLSGINELDYDRSEAERACYCHDNYMLPDKLYMSNIDVVVTERCSLKCRDCSNLMQFYDAPSDYSVDETVDSVKRILDLIDGIYELRFIGGEPFMNPKLDKIMEPFINDDRVKKLLIYSNATIVPREDQWKVFENPKVIFMLTNYGVDKSRAFERIIDELGKRCINYHVLRMDYWNPCDTFEYHDRNNAERIKLFKECCVKNYVTLIKGKLFRCPYSAHAMNLRAVPFCKTDFFDVYSDGKREEKKEKLRRYLFEIESLNTCDYCTSRSFDAELIPVAIQCNKPREYKKYE